MRSESLYMADNPYQPPQPGDVSATAGAGDQGHGLGQSDSAESQILRQRAKNGSGWFFWIAALSLINSVILHNGGEMFFVVGLGITAVADQMALLFIQENPGLESVIHWGAVGFAAVVALIVAGFGWLARKGIPPARDITRLAVAGGVLALGLTMIVRLARARSARRDRDRSLTAGARWNGRS